MPVYIKPSGKEIEINDYAVQFISDLGWTLKGAEPISDIDDDVEFIRAKYERTTGKQPHHRLGVAKMLEAIEDGNS